MTITMSEKIGSKKITKAAQMAKTNGEHTVIYKAIANGHLPPIMFTKLSDYNKSGNKDKIEVIAVIDQNGGFVDIAD